MGRFHCSSHNLEYNSVCPACRDEQAEADRSEILESLSTQTDEMKRQLAYLSYKQGNPGDYKCPECLYVTLKREARRCPVCHSAITKEYWEEIARKAREDAEQRAKQEKVAKEAAEEEKRRKEERLLQEKKQAEKIAWEAAEAKKEAKEAVQLFLGIVFFLGFAALCLVKIISWFN